MSTTKDEKKGYLLNGFLLLFIIILLLHSQLLFITPLFKIFANANTYHNKLLITFITISMFLIYSLGKVLKKRYSFSVLDFIVFFFVLMTVLILILQIITTEEHATLLIGNAYYNFIILLYFPLKAFLTSIQRFISVIRVIISIGFIYTISTIIIYFGIKNNLFPNTNDVTLVQYINGDLRLPQTADFIGITCLLCLCQMAYEKGVFKKETPIFKFIFIICFLTLIFISIVRMMVLTVLATLLIVLYSQAFKKISKSLLISIASLGSILAIFISMEFNIISQFLGEGQQLASALYRFQVIEHFSKHMFDNAIFGFGFSQEIISKYSITDIGFLGFIFKYGLLGLLWLLVLVGIIIRLKVNSLEKTYSVGIITFLSVSFISLSMFDAQRIIFLPILLAILDFLTRSINNEILLCDPPLQNTK